MHFTSRTNFLPFVFCFVAFFYEFSKSGLLPNRSHIGTTNVASSNTPVSARYKSLPEQAIAIKSFKDNVLKDRIQKRVDEELEHNSNPWWLQVVNYGKKVIWVETDPLKDPIANNLNKNLRVYPSPTEELLEIPAQTVDFLTKINRLNILLPLPVSALGDDSWLNKEELDSASRTSYRMFEWRTRVNDFSAYVKILNSVTHKHLIVDWNQQGATLAPNNNGYLRSLESIYGIILYQAYYGSGYGMGLTSQRPGPRYISIMGVRHRQTLAVIQTIFSTGNQPDDFFTISAAITHSEDPKLTKSHLEMWYALIGTPEIAGVETMLKEFRRSKKMVYIAQIDLAWMDDSVDQSNHELAIFVTIREVYESKLPAWHVSPQIQTNIRKGITYQPSVAKAALRDYTGRSALSGSTYLIENTKSEARFQAVTGDIEFEDGKAKGLDLRLNTAISSADEHLIIESFQAIHPNLESETNDVQGQDLSSLELSKIIHTTWSTLKGKMMFRDITFITLEPKTKEAIEQVGDLIRKASDGEPDPKKSDTNTIIIWSSEERRHEFYGKHDNAPPWGKREKDINDNLLKIILDTKELEVVTLLMQNFYYSDMQRPWLSSIEIGHATAEGGKPVLLVRIGSYTDLLDSEENNCRVSTISIDLMEKGSKLYVDGQPRKELSISTDTRPFTFNPESPIEAPLQSNPASQLIESAAKSKFGVPLGDELLRKKEKTYYEVVVSNVWGESFKLHLSPSASHLVIFETPPHNMDFDIVGLEDVLYSAWHTFSSPVKDTKETNSESGSDFSKVAKDSLPTRLQYISVLNVCELTRDIIEGIYSRSELGLNVDQWIIAPKSSLDKIDGQDLITLLGIPEIAGIQRMLNKFYGAEHIEDGYIEAIYIKWQKRNGIDVPELLVYLKEEKVPLEEAKKADTQDDDEKGEV